MNLNEPLISTADVAHLCKVATSTVRTWRYTGRGPQAYQIGKHLRYVRSEVEAWVESGKSQSS